MPPGPAYNWFCVLFSVAEILGHAARYRGAHLPSTTASVKPRRTREPHDLSSAETVKPKNSPQRDGQAQNFLEPLPSERVQVPPRIAQERSDVASLQVGNVSIEKGQTGLEANKQANQVRYIV